MKGAPLPIHVVTHKVTDNDGQGHVNDDDAGSGVVLQYPGEAGRLAAAIGRFAGDACRARDMRRAPRVAKSVVSARS
jgi:hypothetical protein